MRPLGCWGGGACALCRLATPRRSGGAGEMLSGCRGRRAARKGACSPAWEVEVARGGGGPRWLPVACEASFTGRRAAAPTACQARSAGGRETSRQRARQAPSAGKTAAPCSAAAMDGDWGAEEDKEERGELWALTSLSSEKENTYER